MTDTRTTEIEKKSIRELIGMLRPTQAVAVGTVLVSLLTGAFTFGFWSKSQLAKVTESKLQVEITDLTDQAKKTGEEIGILRLKERIIGLLALYYVYRDRAGRDDATDDDQKAFKETAQNLFRTVMRYSDRTLDTGAEPSLRIRVAKGIRPSVRFEFDQTEWPLPEELFAAEE